MHTSHFTRTLLVLSASLLLPTVTTAQLRVSPSSVNINAQGVTTAVITFSGVGGFSMAEALFCGELVSATPASGMRCAPGSVFGQLPARYERTAPGGFGAITDVMTVPASVARRAYQDAAAGKNSAFYYVRRFRNDGGVDQYATVTLRLTSGGAHTPLAITDLKLTFDPEATVLYVANGDVPSDVKALLRYTGSGRISGRWEIVYPGDPIPDANDLLTQATSDPSRTQKRYAQISRFNVFLPPTGRFELNGPDATLLPTAADGQYFILLRIESAFDAESPSEGSTVVDGEFILRTGGLNGGVSPFAAPTLRYVVGSGAARRPTASGARSVRLRAPAANATVDPARLVFAWDALATATQYRVEVGVPGGARVLAALLPQMTRRYAAPPWLRAKAPQEKLQWRVVALDAKGREIGRSAWWLITLGTSTPR